MLSLYNSANINRHRSIFFGLAFILALASISILSPVPVQAAQVTIGWNASSSTVSGYKVYYGLSSGNYTYPVRDAGNSLSYTIPDDITAPTCYITATSYDATQESAKAAELVIYSMTASAGTGGSISSSGTTYATAGSGVTYTITPSSGYKVAGVTVDGASAGAVTSYTFSNVAAAHTISATFSAVTTTYTITASAGANGSISPSGTSTVNAGASQTYTITPSTGYKVAGVTVDGTSVGAVTTYTFSGVAANHTIAATFAVNTYTITASAGANGSISPTGTATVNSGASQAYTITPSTGYKVAGVTVDGTSVGAVTTYTFSNVTANHTIAATFAVNTYTITASAGANGSISPAGTATVNSGASQAYTITPSTGYKVAGVTVDGTSVGAVTTYTFSNVTANHTIAATFAVNTYTITASAGANGSISPAGTATVNSGASQAYTITPSTGYKVAGVTVDGTSVGAVTTYTFSNVTANHTIAATFAVNTYTIAASAGTNGTISPSGTVTVNSGSNQTFTATPSTGYEVADVTVDGSSKGALTSYTFTGITANHTISATFSKVTQPPVAEAGPTQSVAEGTTVTLNGANSSDPGGSTLTYLWAQTGGTAVTLSSTTAAQPTFKAPNVGTAGDALTFKLTVANQGGLQSTDTCIVNVTWVNAAPTANAGSNQTVAEGTTVTLDGTGSTDPDDGIATYLWEQTAGTAVTLTPTTTGQAVFVAPNVGTAGASLTFRLTVTDNGGLKSTSTCVVNITWIDSPPVANAGTDQTVSSGAAVVLNGSASTDPDDGIKSYLWKQTSGTPVTLSSTTAVQPTFTAPTVTTATTLTFQVTVTDNSGLQSTDTCNVYVQQKAGADLTGTWKSLTYNWNRVSGSFTVSNTGNAAAGAFVVRFYLSADGTTLSRLLAQSSLSSLPAAGSKSLSLSYYASGLSGKYIIAVVDANSAVTESNETNNRKSVVIP